MFGWVHRLITEQTFVALPIMVWIISIREGTSGLSRDLKDNTENLQLAVTAEDIFQLFPNVFRHCHELDMVASAHVAKNLGADNIVDPKGKGRANVGQQAKLKSARDPFPKLSNYVRGIPGITRTSMRTSNTEEALWFPIRVESDLQNRPRVGVFVMIASRQI